MTRNIVGSSVSGNGIPNKILTLKVGFCAAKQKDCELNAGRIMQKKKRTVFTSLKTRILSQTSIAVAGCHSDSPILISTASE